MESLAVTYLIANIAQFAACAPQIIQVVRTKDANGLSMKSHEMWFILQLACLPYVFDSSDTIWIFVGCLWALYYALMVWLIARYRYPNYIRLWLQKLLQHRVLLLVRAK
jgi:uncharacterized protein with PQ loop repeat